MSSMVLSPCGSSFSLLVAQPPSRVAASSTAAASIQIRGMGFSGAVVDPTSLGVVVDVERLLQMHGHPGAGLHVDRREGLAVELVDPIGHVRSEEHTSELQSLMRISYAVFCLKK